MKLAFALVAGATARQPSFTEWAEQHGYNSAALPSYLHQNYNYNVAKIDELEAEPGQTATFSVNQFSAMTWREFSSIMLTFRGGSPTWSDAPMLGHIEAIGEEDGVDWDVTPAKDQGGCGSCWAFGTIGGIEAKHKQATGETVLLSEQQLVDCDKSCDGHGTTCNDHCNCGCTGGQADWSYGNYLENTATYTEGSYPYKARNGQCQTGVDSGIRVIGFTQVKSLSNTGMASPGMTDSGLAAAVTQGAVVVAVGVNFQFQAYSSGILSSPPTSCSLDHQVMVTGYASNYWKIKNSWGQSWGENGFIRFARATGGCGPFGLLLYPGSVPTLASSETSEVTV